MALAYPHARETPKLPCSSLALILLIHDANCPLTGQFPPMYYISHSPITQYQFDGFGLCCKWSQEYKSENFNRRYLNNFRNRRPCRVDHLPQIGLSTCHCCLSLKVLPLSPFVLQVWTFPRNLESQYSKVDFARGCPRCSVEFEAFEIVTPF